LPELEEEPMRRMLFAAAGAAVLLAGPTRAESDAAALAGQMKDAKVSLDRG
jgi:hypothetical protein